MTLNYGAGFYQTQEAKIDQYRGTFWIVISSRTQPKIASNLHSYSWVNIDTLKKFFKMLGPGNEIMLQTTLYLHLCHHQAWRWKTWKNEHEFLGFSQINLFSIFSKKSNKKNALFQKKCWCENSNVLQLSWKC